MIENEAFLAEADPARGGTLTRVLDKRSGTELLAGPGNELVLQEEYDQSPALGRGAVAALPEGTGPRLGRRGPRGSAPSAARSARGWSPSSPSMICG